MEPTDTFCFGDKIKEQKNNKKLDQKCASVVTSNVFMIGYVLKLQNDCWYVGITKNLNKRLYQHWNGEGAYFTRKHKPLELVESYIVPADYNVWEHAKTLELMARFGFYKVRGATWVSSKSMSKPALFEELERVSKQRLLDQKREK